LLLYEGLFVAFLFFKKVSDICQTSAIAFSKMLLKVEQIADH